MEKITMNVQDLAKVVAQETGKSQKDARATLDIIGAIVTAQLAEANANQSVEVKVFPGLTMISEYVPAHEARNPLTGGTVMADAKNKVKAKIGSGLKSAVNPQ